MTGAFELSMIPAVLPEIMLILLAVLVLVLDLVYRDRENTALGWITAVGLLVAAGLGVAFSRPAGKRLCPGHTSQRSKSSIVSRRRQSVA